MFGRLATDPLYRQQLLQRMEREDPLTYAELLDAVNWEASDETRQAFLLGVLWQYEAMLRRGHSGGAAPTAARRVGSPALSN